MSLLDKIRLRKKIYNWGEEKENRYILFIQEFKGLLPHRLIIDYLENEQGGVTDLFIEYDHIDFEWTTNFGASFMNGKYTEGYGPKLSKDHGLEKLNSLEDFKTKVVKYFGMKDYKEFSKFFINSNLSETHKNAIRAIID